METKPWYTRKTNIALILLAVVLIVRANGWLEIPAAIDALLLGLAGYGANNHLLNAEKPEPPESPEPKKEEL